jgi:16S rRNA (guanine966-N2)-methyltransferase
MTRIIGGSAGGRRLRTPAGDATRPTSDRVREALFSALESALGTLAGRSFLDLYAGSGAVGLEAASRGAGPVLAVESDRRAAQLVQTNARDLGLAVDVRAHPVARVLGSAPPAAVAGGFDVVFADPPYPLGNDELVAALAALIRNGWVRDGATVVVERSARTVEPAWPAGLVRSRERDYGETVLWYVHAVLAVEQSRGEVV